MEGVPEGQVRDAQAKGRESLAGQGQSTHSLSPKVNDEEWLTEVFSYHKPEGDQPAKYEAIRVAAKSFAQVILQNVPPCADRTAALRKLREAVMTANAAVALKGLV
jgi:hypothetical protein